MFGKGDTDPRAEEIACENFPGRAVGGEIIDGVRKRLPTIARIIEHDYEEQTCVVSEKYYTLFRNRRQGSMFEMTDAEAQKCLPIGHGNRSEGLHRCEGDNDVIYQASLGQNLAAGTGLVVTNTNRAIKPTEEGHIPEERSGRLADNLKQKLNVVPEGDQMRQLARRAAKRRNQKK